MTAVPPQAAKKTTTANWHGVELRDDYAWLRVDNWMEVMRDPSKLADDVRSHLEAENAYSADWLADTSGLQETLFAEMKGRIKEDDSSVPQPDGPWLYYSRYETGKQYPLFCRKPRDTDYADRAGEVVLMDGNAEAEGKAFWRLGAFSHGPDHAQIAYAVDENGSELFTLRIRDVATGADLADEISDVSSVSWSADGRSLVYVKVDENHRPRWVYRHEIGAAVAEDVLIYEETDPGFFVGVGKSKSGDLIEINAHRHETSEVRLLDAHDLSKEPRLVAARREGHEYDIDQIGDQLIIVTNSDGAVDKRICVAPLANPGEETWRELIPHRPGCLILGTDTFSGHLVRLERENSLPRVVIRDWDSGDEHAIAFDEEAYSLGMSGGYEFDTTSLRFSYSSMTTPSEVYDYDMATRERVLRKRQEVPSGHDASDYVTRRILAPARDGETVPVSIVHHKSTPIDGTAPLFLYGYGSYGIAMPAGFSTSRLSLVDRGFVYAIAHIRGGKEKGYGWYLDGKREKKKNTFHDFIDAGRHLVSEGYSAPDRVIAQGGSAGGMLMGAVTNMAPDLFAGIIANVPFVDVLNTMLDKDLPLTPPEWPEWGNPIEDADAFHYIQSYSPYDQVEAKAYPHVFALAGLTDPRVTYWEPAKWVARLRELKTNDATVLLHTNMDAGHGGASGRFESLKEVAKEYAFALKVAGVKS